MSARCWPRARRKLNLFIEKPLATDARDSRKVLKAIEQAGVDAVMGYTNRFRRRFQAVEDKLVRGEIGDVTSVVTRAFMNRMVPIATIRKTNQRQNLHADGGLGHPRARHVDVPDGGQDAGVGVCPLGRQGARDVGHARTRPSASSPWTTARSGA